MTTPTALIDPFARRVRDLRLSVTDRCNFRCTYCMPEEGMEWLPRSEVLTFEELERIARILVDVHGKWAGHAIGKVQFVKPRRSMSQIGG